MQKQNLVHFLSCQSVRAAAHINFSLAVCLKVLAVALDLVD